MIARKLKLMLLPLVAMAALSSCSWEDGMDGPGPGNGNEVVFSMRVPASHTLTRAFADAEPEYEVRTLDVLLFNTSTGKLLSRATNSGTPKVSGRDLDFYVKLAKEDGVADYDFILLANCQSEVNSSLYSGGILRTELTKAEVQAALKASIGAGTAWPTTSGSEWLMPMWGELNNQTIEAGKTYARTSLLRATVKIDLEVDLGSSPDTFELEEVHYYNYNTQGYVIPVAANLENGKAKTPTIGGLTLNTADPVNYSTAISADKKSLKYAIYGFEGPEGSLTDMDNNPCLLIKGSFNGGEGTWYRFDFASVDPDDLSTTYLPLLRNHQYNVKITAVNGPGYTDPDDALASKPGNLGTNITIWDGGNVNGQWNGNYEIKFTGYEAHFTQFATPTLQEIKITTNVPELSFEGFTNVAKGTASGEGNWTPTTPASSGTWTNGHFTVVISKGAPVGDKTTYTLKVTAEPTTGEATDPARESRFKVKGQNMEATITVTQDSHEAYRLITSPDPLTDNITIDGAKQRIKIEVESTHNYDILLNHGGGAAMFTGVWDAQTGGNQITTLTDIDKSRKVVYVEADSYGMVVLRVGTFVIQHNDPQSEVSPKQFNVLQVTPAIQAVLAEGGYAAEIPKAGGSKTINVTSNMAAWTAQVSLKVGTGTDNALADADLAGLFDKTTGSGNETVKFTLPALSDSETDDKVYTVTFKDVNGATTSAPAIVITQKAKLLGSGGGGIPPTGEVRGEPGILCVNSKGQLNLDGEGWIVYFKWGSTIATAGGPKSDPFTSDRIAWTPEGYPYQELVAAVDRQSKPLDKWNKVPYQPSGSVIVENASAGTGDPCKLAVKGGVVGEYRMPTGNPYEQFTDAGWEANNNGIGGRNSSQGQFYPAAGIRSKSEGAIGNVGTHGYYWASSYNNTNSFYLHFASSSHSDGYHNIAREFGFPIRCVR